MSNKRTSLECYQYFCEKEGNQDIAGVFALEKILDIIDLNKPKRILEVGLGIGSISYTVLKNYANSDREMIYHGTEANAYCLNALKETLGEYYKSISIYKDLDAVKSEEKYDLIIIDGSDEATEKIKNLIAENGVIFVEHGRADQTKIMKTVFPKHKHAACRTDFKNPKGGPFPEDKWCAGGQLIYVNPTFKQRLHYQKESILGTYRGRFKRKILSKLNG